MSVSLTIEFADGRESIDLPVSFQGAWLAYWSPAAKQLECRWVLSVDTWEIIPPDAFRELVDEFVLLRNYFNYTPLEQRRPGDGWWTRLRVWFRAQGAFTASEYVRERSVWIVERLSALDADAISKISEISIG